jgi:hypothetical protein
MKREIFARFTPVIIEIFSLNLPEGLDGYEDKWISIFNTYYGDLVVRAVSRLDPSLARYIREHPGSRDFLSRSLDNFTSMLPTEAVMNEAWVRVR